MFARHSFKIADGSRLFDASNDKLWLAVGGKRHHLICRQVYTSLFVKEVDLQEASPSVLASIPEGPELLFGTSLVRRAYSIAVHFLAVHPKGIVLHYVPSKDIFDRCGFDINLCRSLPASTFDRLKAGTPLS